MTANIQEIEQAVTQLSPEQLADFRAWFTEFETQHNKQHFVIKSSGEDEDWQRLATQNLVSAYGDDEPEYTVTDLQKQNPGYRAS
jgi:uncharacterized protein YecA (UPF0149 family)